MIWLTLASNAVARTWQTGVLVLTLQHCDSIRQPLACLSFTESDCACGLLLCAWPSGKPGNAEERTQFVSESLRPLPLPTLNPTPGPVVDKWNTPETVTPPWQRGCAAGPHVHEHTCVTVLYAPAALRLFLMWQKLTATWHMSGLTLGQKVNMQGLLQPESLCSSLPQATLRTQWWEGFPKILVSKSYQLLLQKKEAKPQKRTQLKYSKHRKYFENRITTSKMRRLNSQFLIARTVNISVLFKEKICLC